MSNGLFAVDGVDVAGLVAEHLGPRVLAAVLHKPGAIQPRDLANPTQAPGRGAPRHIPCRGFIADFSEASIDGQLILAGDRKVTLLAQTINRGRDEPEGGVDKDQVTIEGGFYNITRVIARDPAGATFTLQVRKP